MTTEVERQTDIQQQNEQIGKPMRPDDLQNFFRAPDIKPDGAIFGEDIDQFGQLTAQPLEGLPPETHPQEPSTPVSREQEEPSSDRPRQ